MSTRHAPFPPRLLASLLLVLGLLACDDSPSTALEAADATLDVGRLVDALVDAASCVPQPERCNGLDDDCDGRVDEGFDGLGGRCTVGEGPCAGQGRRICSPDETEVICDAQAREPGPEICNGVDDDCDGAVDEGIDLARDPENCGSCGRMCTFENGAGRCVQAVCELAGCAPGFGDADGLAFNGCECAIEGPERCNGLDDDCDGAVDEGFPLGEPCWLGVGACEATGAWICGDEGEAACDAAVGVGSAELCNGIDDDCDGQVDEGFDRDGDGFPGCGVDCAGPCPEGVDCAVLCPIQDCDDEDPERSPGTVEICGDGIDQNCDGRDSPCGRTEARMDSLVIAPPGEAQSCRDVDGDRVPDNAFAPLAALANPLLAQSLQDGSLTLLPSVEGLPVGFDDGRFDLSLLRGQPAGLGRVRVTPDSFGPDGLPRMLFRNALLVAGALRAGPGDFQLGLPVPGGLPGELRVQSAEITGSLRLDARGLTIEGATVTGAVTEADLLVGLATLPPELVPVVANLLTPDIDLDGDGEPDSYSACLFWSAVPVIVVD